MGGGGRVGGKGGMHQSDESTRYQQADRPPPAHRCLQRIELNVDVCMPTRVGTMRRAVLCMSYGAFTSRGYRTNI